jgi:hypothetical protein
MASGSKRNLDRSYYDIQCCSPFPVASYTSSSDVQLRSTECGRSRALRLSVEFGFNGLLINRAITATPRDSFANGECRSQTRR